LAQPLNLKGGVNNINFLLYNKKLIFSIRRFAEELKGKRLYAIIYCYNISKDIIHLQVKECFGDIALILMIIYMIKELIMFLQLLLIQSYKYI
jgi:hypothetical protein